MTEQGTSRRFFVLAILIFWSGIANASENHEYRAVLRAQGVEIPFFLDWADSNVDFAVIRNGYEKIMVRMGRDDKGGVDLSFTHYGSIITAKEQPDHSFVGNWEKLNSKKELESIEFLAIPLSPSTTRLRFPREFKITEEIEKHPSVEGKWAVKFSSDDTPSIGVFMQDNDKNVEGTFLTTTGDYRYLAGSYEHGLLRLSCFDGTHAFLFHAKMQSDGTLKGDFWSGAKWHETWTAKRDDKAALPNGFSLTKINPKARLKELKFPDLDGKERSLSEPGLLGKATVVEIFGSWCPNCHDAADLLVDLEKTYGPRGFKIVGLAFESGDAERDALYVRRYLERHNATYQVLLAGVRDKDKASARLPVIEKLQGYPTFLFVDRDGTIRSAYTGFSGPATGEEYTKLRKQFEGAVEKLLANDSK
jgi:thiol-disulfide isomerase/thioredoxin